MSAGAGQTQGQAGSGAQAAPYMLVLAPALFVLLWSSGFIGAKFGLPAAPPATFLVIRFVGVLALMIPIALAVRAPWPADWRQVAHIAVAGLLVQAGYLGGVFFAIDRGMSAGLAALIVSLQPILTAVAAAPLLRERVSARQWLGLALGLGGTVLVVADKLSIAGLTLVAIGYALIALASMTAGTLYQKRYCGAFDLRSGSVIQFAIALVVMAPFAAFESRPVAWTPVFVAAVAYLVVALSIIAISMLAVLIRRGAATKVVSLFYLVPPTTALIAFVAFGETMSSMAIAGMIASVIGVALVVRQ